MHEDSFIMLMFALFGSVMLGFGLHNEVIALGIFFIVLALMPYHPRSFK